MLLSIPPVKAASTVPSSSTSSYVELVIVGAIGLTDREGCKIYCVIEHGSEVIGRTKAKKSVRPEWNHSIIIDTKKERFIKLSLWDKEAYGKDEFLGEASFEISKMLANSGNLSARSLRNLTTKENQIYRYTLHNRMGRFGSVSGEVTVSYKFTLDEPKPQPDPDFSRLKRRAQRKSASESKSRRLKLDFSNSRLKDTVPPFIGKISKDWTHFNLSFNNFPSFPDLSKFTNLKFLNIGYCNIKDLSPHVGELVALKDLSLIHNNIAELPEALTTLSKLKRLDVSYNKLSILGAEIGKIKRLKELYIVGNPLVLIAPQLGELEHLRVLDLSCCRLLGLPDEIGGLSKLTDLNITVNNLGELPPTIGKLTQLNSLHISNNQLSDLPDALGECKNITSLTIEGGNQFVDPEIVNNFRQSPQKLIEYLSDRKAASRRALLPPSALKGYRSSVAAEPEYVNPPKNERRKSRLSWAVFGGTEEKLRPSLLDSPQAHHSLSGGNLSKRLSQRFFNAISSDRRSIIVQEGPNAHQFAFVQFFGQVPCYHCRKAIWGMGKNGYECTNCHIAVHKKCLDNVEKNCSTPLSPTSAKSNRRRSLFVYNLEKEVKVSNTASKKNINEGTAKDPTFLFLVQACKLGDAATLRRLLDTKQSKPIHLRIQHSTDSNTPIHVACFFGHTECVRALLEKDPDLINNRNGAGMAPIHTAAKVGKDECLKLLLEKGADINVRDYTEGATALHHAAERGKAACVKMLLEKGANPMLTNAKGKTALDKALLRGYMEIAVLLGYVPRTPRTEPEVVEELVLFGFPSSEDPISWIRKKLNFLTDTFELLQADFSLFDINGSGFVVMGELIAQLDKLKESGTHSIASSLSEFIKNKTDDSVVIDLSRFTWLVYNLVADESNATSKDFAVLRKGFRILEKLFKIYDRDQTGFVTKDALAECLSHINGVPIIDIQNLLTYDKAWRFLENVNEMDFPLFMSVLRRWTLPEIIEMEVETEGDDYKRKKFSILDTISLNAVTKALKDEFEFPAIEIQFNRPGTNRYQPIKKNRDWETAIVAFKSKRSPKITKLKLLISKKAEPVATAQRGSRIVLPSKPKMAFNLDMKKAEDAALPPIVHWLKNPEREKYPWEVPASEFQLGKMVGRGAYGEVYEGTFRGKRVAIKKLLDSIRQEDVFKSFVKEIKFLAQCEHEHILTFYGACLEHPNICCITEFMDKGCVNDVITKENVEWTKIVKMALDAAYGLQYLHSRSPPIIHKDIKSFNFLVGADYRVVIADFGVSDELNEEDPKAGMLGTFNWMPPEAFDPGVYDTKSDIYSYGMVLWEMLTGQIPFGTVNNHLMVLQLIDSGERPHIPAATPEPMANLIRECLAAEPEKRPGWPSIIQTLQSLLTSEPESTTVTPRIATTTETEGNPVEKKEAEVVSDDSGD